MKKFLLCVVVLLALGGIALLMWQPAVEEPKEDVTAEPETVTVKRLDTSVSELREGELVFSFSMNDFIEGFNSVYQQEHGEAYLPTMEKWQSTVYDDGILAKHETYYYQFSEDETVWSLPTIAVYVPADADCVQKLTVNFDDHSYTEQMYQHYEKLCGYTLKTLFPELADDKVTALYQTINQLAYDNFSAEKYTADAIPCALYHKDGVGVYPYFVVGSTLRLCVVPVTPEYLAELEAKGTAISEIA